MSQSKISKTNLESNNASLPHRPSLGEHIIFGGISGCIGTSFTSPLDVMKTHLQATGVARECSLLRYATHIYSTQGGLRPFFKGLPPSILGILPHRAISFGSYYQYKDWFGKENCFKNLSAGICASLTANLSTSPLWMIKVKSQLDTQRKSFTHHCKDILRLRGIRGFYCGFYATCAGSVGEGIYLLIYEVLKSYIAGNSQHATVMQCIFASGVAKLTIASVFYPVEVVRIQLQQDSTKSYREILLKLRKQKFSRLYSGLSLHLPKNVLGTAIMFGTFELLIRWI